jgi:FAD/FMN-containing dehydrogenase
MRGGGTSLAGQTCNTALVIDFSRYLDRVLDLDPENRRAYVEPGCILDTLRDAAEEHNLTFGPDPATHTHNTLGGMIGNNSGGVHSVMAGLTVDNVEELDILTYQGERFTVGPTTDEELADILSRDDAKARLYRQLVDFRDRYADLIRDRFPDIPRRVSGYSNLDWLLPEKGFHVARALVGTEATCVIVLGAKLKLVPSPPERTTVVLGFPTIFEAADAVPRVLEHGPLACEGLDSKLIENLDTKSLHTEKFELLPDGEGWLVVEFGADGKEEADAQAQGLIDAFMNDEGVDHKLLSSANDQKRLRLLRESGLGATAYVPGEPETWEGWEDTAVPRERLGDYLRAFRKLLDRHGYDTVMYGHFGDGLVHCRINFDLGTEKGLKTLRTSSTRPPISWWLRRLAVRRARRRAGAGGASGEDVRGRTRPGLPRIQGDLGPASADESGQGDRPVSDSLQPAHRPAFRPARSEDGIRIPGRSGELCPRHHALRRRRQVPAA